MPRPALKNYGRLSPLPDAPKDGKPPALDFMNLTSDVITFLRYAKTAERQLLDVCPDAKAKSEMEECLAKCGDAMSRLMVARQNTLSRYTPAGARKPNA